MSYNAKQYWNTLLENSFDDTGVCWPNWPLSYNRHLHRQQKYGFNKILQKYAIELSQKKVCEIGPGNGFWTNLFFDSDVSEYRGFDITKSSVEKLTFRYPTFSFEECDFSQYQPCRNEIGNFDLVISVLVFLHITNNQKFEACFHNISTMLANNGYCIVLDAVSKNKLRGKQQKMADGINFDEHYHNKVRYMDYYISTAAAYGIELVGSYPAFNMTQNAFDFKSFIGFKMGTWYFNKILNPLLLNQSEKRGDILGKILVVIDNLFFSKISTSSKWLVFRKAP